MDQDDRRFHGRIDGEQHEPKQKDGLLIRFIYMLLIWAMIHVANIVLGAATVVQAILMLLSNGAPNPRLADFGESLGIWIAKAARFQTGASEVKPWPWTELD